MKISYCVPCKNRTDDLKQSLVTVIAAAEKSPPIEIVILDYSSDDGLEEYAQVLPQLNNGNTIIYIRCEGYKYYHMAHARNLSLLAGDGEYLVAANADNLISDKFFNIIRDLIAKESIWMTANMQNSLLVIQKKEFIDAGGFDERFEFYGPEDKEIIERLHRRSIKHKRYSRSLISAIYTPDEKKTRGYRKKKSKQRMHNLGMVFLEDSRAKGTLVANPDGWGKS